MERHGATVLGSTRAEWHEWRVNVDSAVADQVGAGRRQIHPMAPRLDVKKLAAEVAQVVQEGPETRSNLVKNGIVVWNGAQEITIKHTALIPNRGFGQTVASRRARFKNQLIKAMETLGWQCTRQDHFMTFKRLTVLAGT